MSGVDEGHACVRRSPDNSAKAITVRTGTGSRVSVLSSGERHTGSFGFVEEWFLMKLAPSTVDAVTDERRHLVGAH